MRAVAKNYVLTSHARVSTPYGITWAHSLWASDPSWTPPADGAAVTSWRNNSGGGDPAAAGGVRPTYRASVPVYNYKPTVEFDRASSQVLDVDITDVAQPYSVVVIGNTSGATNAAERLTGQGTATAAGMGDSSGNVYSFASTTPTISGSACNSLPHLFRGYASGATSLLAVDGTVQAGPANAGATAMTRLCVGAGAAAGPAFNNYLAGHLAFVGVFAGDVAADAGWSDFKVFARTFYGLAIA